MADETLSQCVQSLPQELYDEIFELVFTASSAQVVIDRTYKPPSSMRVTRATRSQFTTQYYHKSAFVFAEERLCRRGAELLSLQHFNLVSRFVVLETCPSTSQLADLTTEHAMQRFQMNTFRTIMKLFGRYSKGLGFQPSSYPSELAFIDYNSGPRATERWTREESAEGMLFTKICEYQK